MVCFTSIKKASSISRVQISSSSSPTKQQPEEKRRQEETHPALRTPILAERRHENPSVLPHIRLARRARAIEQQAPPPPPLPCSEQRAWRGRRRRGASEPGEGGGAGVAVLRQLRRVHQVEPGAVPVP